MENSISIVGNTISNQEKEDNVFEKYSFESVITKLEKPIGKGCPVYFLNSSTGQIIYKTETDEFSKVYAPNLRKYVKYLVIATDILDVYNSVVFDLTWDFSSPLKSNYSLSYYNIYDLDNIQSIFE